MLILLKELNNKNLRKKCSLKTYRYILRHLNATLSLSMRFVRNKHKHTALLSLSQKKNQRSKKIFMLHNNINFMKKSKEKAGENTHVIVYARLEIILNT